MNDHDGQNVVFHEFAHQIDDLTGSANGVPVLSDDQSFSEWESAFLTAYDAHVRAVDSGQPTVIDPYGAEGHEEFFAVSVEVFLSDQRPCAGRTRRFTSNSPSCFTWTLLNGTKGFSTPGARVPGKFPVRHNLTKVNL